MFVDPALIEYAVKLANATRDVAAVGLGELSRYVTYGASPRASINLILAGRALALVRGREYALPQDLREIAPDVLRHRFVLSYEALADGVTADDIIDRILAAVPVPELALRERMTRGSTGVEPTHGRNPHPRRRDAGAAPPAASSGRSSAGSTGCCRATTARSSAASAPTSATCASTSPATTSATSTGT